MGHSKNHGRRGLTLPLQLRAKLIGLSILIAGQAPMVTCLRAVRQLAFAPTEKTGAVFLPTRQIK